MRAQGLALAVAWIGATGCIAPDEAGLRDADGDGVWELLDCDDGDPLTSPEADERCDGRDNDCDGEIDEPGARDGWTLYDDRDGDGWGDLSAPRAVCQPELGLVGEPGDCDDLNPFAHPGADERCDGEDNDCDGDVDEAGASDGAMRWADQDRDGFGDPLVGERRCTDGTAWVENDLDCDDLRADVSPAAQELCDPYDVDEDCDGEAEDADPSAAGPNVWYRDADEDGWGDAGETIEACDPQGRYTADQAGDCDDDRAWLHPRETCPDGDGDGYGTEPETQCIAIDEAVTLCGDCDDADAAVHPGAEDLFYDGIDTNCDEANDYDADGDGVGADAWGGYDCDDAEPSVHPDATDTWYDGVDTDCDGADDFDADGDGYGSADYGGEDCDDADAEISPDAVEWIGDDADQDCDGEAQVADVILSGVTADDGFGTALSAADADGDGAADLWIGAPGEVGGAVDGAVWLLSGPLDDTSSASGAARWAFGAGDMSGAALDGAGDLDGDGYPELAVGGEYADDGGTNSGLVWVFAGPATAGGTEADASATLTGDSADHLGFAVSAAADLDGDGLADLAAGAPEDDGGAPQGGAALLVYGAWTGDMTQSEADAVVLGESSNLNLGESLAPLLDHDGDGLDELLIGAPAAGTGCGGSWAGIASGPPMGWITQLDLDVQLTTAACETEAGAALHGGDLDGDGYGDVAVGAPLADVVGSDSGAVYVHLGPVVSGAVEDAALRFEGAQDDDRAGGSLQAGDLDGDGTTDLLIGGPGSTSRTGLQREARLVWGAGATAGALALACSDDVVCLRGWADERVANSAVLGDLDADGLADLALGTPYVGSGGSHMSQVWLLWGSRW